MGRPSASKAQGTPGLAPSKINTLHLVRNFETDPMQSTILRKNPKSEKSLREKIARIKKKNLEKSVKVSKKLA